MNKKIGLYRQDTRNKISHYLSINRRHPSPTYKDSSPYSITMRTCVLALFALICVALAAPIYPKATLQFLQKNPTELEKLNKKFENKHNYDSLRSEITGKDISLAKRHHPDPITLPEVASYPLWYLNINQTGTSRFVFNNQGAKDVCNVPVSPFIPVRTIVRASTQEWYTEDGIAGQYTGPNYSLIWTRQVVDGVLTTFCLANRTATFLNQQLAHNTPYLQDLKTYLGVKVRNGRSNNWREDVRQVYFFNGLTNDFGGTTNGTMDFLGFFDAYDLTPYQFGFDQPQVDARVPYGTGVCSHKVDNVGGEYRFDDENAGFFPVTSASIINFVDAACHPGGDKNVPINPLLLPDVDSAWCGQ